MAYTVRNDDCIACDSCLMECPTGAIKPRVGKEGYWIDPTLCDDCADIERPRCIAVCDVGSLTPLQRKKGRSKSNLLPAAIPDIFLNGKTTPFASCMVVWEACNVLAMQQALPWQIDSDGKLCHSRAVHRDRGKIRFRLAAAPDVDFPPPLDEDKAKVAISNFDIRAACIHLIFAAYAMTVDYPWQNVFVLNDQHIEQYLGLDKRKDMTKLDKLTLIKNLVYQSCQILVTLDWPRQGKVQPFTANEHPVWHLIDTQYYFEEDSQGYRHLIGLGFTVRAGIWAQHFLNKQQYSNQTAFYQYGVLPQSLLKEVMGNWQQHAGAMRLLLWLLFKLRLGSDNRLTVRTLLRIAYGEERLMEAITVRGAHKRLLKIFEGDLETVYYYGLKPLFDPETYPPEIQPLWARLADIPDDADDALEFWVNDANRELSLTNTAPRNKWQRLLNARLLGFEVSAEWQEAVRRAPTRRRSHQSKKSQTVEKAGQLSGADIKAARQRHGLSQRALADLLGKSQSWIRDIEKGRFRLSLDDQTLLRKTLQFH